MYLSKLFYDSLVKSEQRFIKKGITKEALRVEKLEFVSLSNKPNPLFGEETFYSLFNKSSYREVVEGLAKNKINFTVLPLEPKTYKKYSNINRFTSSKSSISNRYVDDINSLEKLNKVWEILDSTFSGFNFSDFNKCISMKDVDYLIEYSFSGSLRSSGIKPDYWSFPEHYKEIYNYHKLVGIDKVGDNPVIDGIRITAPLDSERQFRLLIEIPNKRSSCIKKSTMRKHLINNFFKNLL